MVFVTGAGVEGREVAHSLQNLESEGLLVSHLGHLTVTIYPFNELTKE
jgi:hypothetical protein